MILLDTCTLLWLASDQSQLSPAAVGLIRQHAGFLFVSAITAFELGLKQRQRRLTLPLTPEAYYLAALAHHGVHEIPVDGPIAAHSTALPDLHRDPADRILVATAQRRNLTILTPDRHIRAYPELRVEW